MIILLICAFIHLLIMNACVYAFVHSTKHPWNAQHVPDTGLVVGDSEVGQQWCRPQGATVPEEEADYYNAACTVGSLSSGPPWSLTPVFIPLCTLFSCVRAGPSDSLLTNTGKGMGCYFCDQVTERLWLSSWAALLPLSTSCSEGGLLYG